MLEMIADSLDPTNPGVRPGTTAELTGHSDPSGGPHRRGPAPAHNGRTIKPPPPVHPSPPRRDPPVNGRRWARPPPTRAAPGRAGGAPPPRRCLIRGGRGTEESGRAPPTGPAGPSSGTST